MDLFTEFTTIAVMPVLEGRATVRSLARFWSLIYVGNLLGAALFAMLTVTFGARFGLVEAPVLAGLGTKLTDHTWWVILISAALAGWLMGLLSWLIVGGRDTISQIVFIWIIGSMIGFGQLHHCVVGTAQVLAGAWAGGGAGTNAIAHFLVWTTIGNAIGGVVFACSIHWSTQSKEEEERGRTGRDSRVRAGDEPD